MTLLIIESSYLYMVSNTHMVMLTIYIQLIIFNIHIWLCLPYTYNQYYFNNLIYYNKYIKYAELKSQFRTFKEFQTSGIKIELKGGKYGSVQN